MSYVGAPMVYYGTEAGMWGGHDPDDRMPMVWADLKFDPQAIDPRGTERKPDSVDFDRDLFEFYKRAINLRREHEALTHGDYSVLTTEDNQRTLVLKRHSPKETLLVAFNRGDKDATVAVHVSAEKLKPIFITHGELSGIKPKSAADTTEFVLPPLTGVAFSYN
jgi:glycosidase